jgi:hypothetical protein
MAETCQSLCFRRCCRGSAFYIRYFASCALAPLPPSHTCHCTPRRHQHGCWRDGPEGIAARGKPDILSYVQREIISSGTVLPLRFPPFPLPDRITLDYLPTWRLPPRQGTNLRATCFSLSNKDLSVRSAFSQRGRKWRGEEDSKYRVEEVTEGELHLRVLCKTLTHLRQSLWMNQRQVLREKSE